MGRKDPWEDSSIEEGAAFMFRSLQDETRMARVLNLDTLRNEINELGFDEEAKAHILSRIDALVRFTAANMRRLIATRREARVFRHASEQFKAILNRQQHELAYYQLRALREKREKKDKDT